MDPALDKLNVLIDKMMVGAVSLAAAFSAVAGDLVIATVNNGHMIEMHKHTADFEKAFPGIKLKWVTTFGPGNLVLTGPRLPHNWISTDVPPEGVPLRDHCVIFNRAPIDQAAAVIPELRELVPLLDRATQGVLSQCENYRLLSNAWLPAPDHDDKAMNQIDTIVTYITEHFAEALTLTDVAKRFRMSESHFSRTFRRGTGNSFTDFLIRVRISRACQLLMQSDDHVGTICDDVGFNNVANFNRRFLDVKGTTPSAFRQEARSNFS